MVVKTLLGEGCRVVGMTIVDEGLWYKLRNNFPRINPEYIRILLARHNNQEHETIAAILYAQSSRGCRYDPEPKIKLRYLKVLFPEVDEDHIYDLLHNNGHNARIVMETLEKMGFEKAKNVFLPGVEKRIMKEERPARPTSIRLQFPAARSDKDKVLRALMEEFPDVSPVLVELALECSFYDKEKATIFLKAMTPQDSDKYFPKPQAPATLPIVRGCVATQTGCLVDTVIDVPITIPRKEDSIEVETQDQATWTEEDGVIQKEVPPRLAKGPNRNYISQKSTERVTRVTSSGPKETNRQGAKKEWISSAKGSQVGRVGASGPNLSFRTGPDSSLRIKKYDKSPFDHFSPFHVD
jgi:hypothetical protein